MKKLVILLFNVILLFSCTNVIKKHRTITTDSEGELILYVIGVKEGFENRMYYLNAKASAADTVLAIIQPLNHRSSQTYKFGDKLMLKKVK